ncbi:MAG TPA: hypothetical protein VFC09_00950 [Candidatus Dormibacteraeota bacterium]|nr:hypothetical protein [Candidatus Dormibacteraeota bacterium]
MHRRILLALLPLALLAWPMGAHASGTISLTTAVYPASNCTVTVTFTVEHTATAVPSAEDISVKATCGINGYGEYIDFASLSASDSLGNCGAGAVATNYPVTRVGPGTCRVTNPIPGPHKVDIFFSFDPHDATYSPGCSEDTTYDPSYEGCNWTQVFLVA